MRGIISSLFVKKCEFCKRLNFRVCPNCLPKIANLKHSQDAIPYFLNYHDEKIRKLIWKFKYKNEVSIATDLAPLIGDFIYEQIENNLDLQSEHIYQNIYIIPAPITNDPTRYRMRNHMLVMANEVQKYLKKLEINATVCDCLAKSGTKRMAMILGKKKRTAHIEKSISLKSPPPKEGLIFIIDDVTTTGATLKKIKKLVTTKQAFVQIVALAH